MSEETIKCPKCGKENDEKAAFCEECGNNLKKVENEQQRTVTDEFSNIEAEYTSVGLSAFKFIVFVILPLVWIYFLIKIISGLDYSGYNIGLDGLSSAVLKLTGLQIFTFSTIIAFTLIILWVVVFYTHKFSYRMRIIEKNIQAINKKVK